jgi:Protein of unknown function (DUF1501)
MLGIGQAVGRTCAGWTRRDVLQVGGLSALGLGLADVLRGEARAPGRRREKSCIVLWLDGGPSHLETFDPKPDTPDPMRGPYGAIRTSVTGVQFCELLPMLAARMSRCALIRSMNHRTDAHSPIPVLTAFSNSNTALGAVVAKFKGPIGQMPPYVHVGSKLGIGGGTLGAAFNPIEVRDPTGGKVTMPQFQLRADVPAARMHNRRELLASVDRMRRAAHASREVEQMGHSHRRAADLLTSPKVRNAFDLAREKDELRERYGANFFGQSCLLARRLVEAGTRFVQVRWYDHVAFDSWDVHGADLGGMVRMEQQLCPRLDQGLSALLDDLRDRGLFGSTLVLAVGEFGRTPGINKYGARDHWPYCFSALLAGGGLPEGVVVGASDRDGGRPAHTPVGPADLAATVYRLLGIDTNTDPRVRPFIGTAQPVGELV